MSTDLAALRKRIETARPSGDCQRPSCSASGCIRRRTFDADLTLLAWIESEINERDVMLKPALANLLARYPVEGTSE